MPWRGLCIVRPVCRLAGTPVDPAPHVSARVAPPSQLQWRVGDAAAYGVGGVRRSRRSGVDAAATLEGAAEGDLVGVLQVATDGQARRKPGHGETDVAQ